MDISKMFSMEGKVALVTGGAGYLGFQMALALAEAGANVVIASRNIDNCRKKADYISNHHREALALKLDISDEDSVKESLSEIIDKFGRIDILVNNAGGSVADKFETAELKDYMDVMNLNCTGMFLCSQIFGRWMKEHGGGNIINISSMYGLVGADQKIYEGSDNRQPASYAMAKGGVISFTRFLAVYWATDNIRVNCLSPGGFIRNKNPDFQQRFFQRVPMGREGRSDEIKGAVVFLASDASSYVTGHNLVVDGGWTAW